MVLTQIGLAQNNAIYWSTFSSGFAVSSSANTSMKSIVGQSLVGSSRQSNTRIQSGLLADTILTGFFVNVHEGEQLPAAFRLYQNYPNPFNPTTSISFDLPKNAFVTLKIYNVLGQGLFTLIDRQSMQAGKQDVKFNANNLPSGIYFYDLTAEGIRDGTGSTAGQEFISVKKMILLR